MENYKEKLTEQKIELEALLKSLKRELSKLKDGEQLKIKIGYSNGYVQYNYVNPNNGKRIYIKKNQRIKVKKSFQKEYYEQVQKILEKQLGILDAFLNKYDIESINKFYDGMPFGRKILVSPIIEPDENYVKKWLNAHSGEQNSYPGEGEIITSTGIYVRSKSEKIIAELLDKYRIPYRYECGITLNNGKVVYPDFTVLNVRLRKTIYWEHLGLIGYDEYAYKNLQKINEYERAGYELGNNLIITMECSGSRFDSRFIEDKIKKYCI
ncbi:MAG: hypothetical protein K6F63_04975 [Lachnospiraceae bacterium]|nr:hypothetical protein [Lachnospiraceae bacterium]